MTPAGDVRSSWAVITANVGGYDTVHPVPADAADADWVYVTDCSRTERRAERLGWRPVRAWGPQADSRFLLSRYPKAVPQEFTDRPRSIYVDARFRIESATVVDRLSTFVDGESWIALYRHDDRDCLFDEADECQRLGLSSPSLNNQIEHYRSIGVPRHMGLWCGGVIVRIHGAAQRTFGDAWYAELRRWPTRDQISLPVVLDRTGTTPCEIPGSVYSSPRLKVTPHRVSRSGGPRAIRHAIASIVRSSRAI